MEDIEKTYWQLKMRKLERARKRKLELASLDALLGIHENILKASSKEKKRQKTLL